MGEVQFVQKNDSDFRLLSSFQITIQGDSANGRRTGKSEMIVPKQIQTDGFRLAYQAMASSKPLAVSDDLNKLSPFLH